MKAHYFAVLAMLLLPASASAQWSHSVSFKYAPNTAIRIQQPEGFAAEVDGRKDTLPAVFTLANRSAYVWVQVTAKDGAVWRKKVEVKSRQESTLDLRYAPPASRAQPARAAVSHVGTFENRTHRCSRKHRRPLRFSVYQNGKVVASPSLNVGKARNATLARGRYFVQIQAMNRRGAWSLIHKLNYNVDRDGWSIFYGCK